MLAPLFSVGIFCSRVLGYFGIISYSMYMWHVPVVLYGRNYLRLLGVRGGIGWTPTNLLCVLGLTLACVAISELTYRVIELPFLRRKTRLTAGRTEPVAQSS